MTTQTQPIYYVHFDVPMDGKRDYFFGSISAIYSEFTPAQIGVRIDEVYRSPLRELGTLSTKTCNILYGRLIRKPTNRGKYGNRVRSSNKPPGKKAVGNL